MLYVNLILCGHCGGYDNYSDKSIIPSTYQSPCIRGVYSILSGLYVGVCIYIHQYLYGNALMDTPEALHDEHTVMYVISNYIHDYTL